MNVGKSNNMIIDPTTAKPISTDFGQLIFLVSLGALFVISLLPINSIDPTIRLKTVIATTQNVITSCVVKIGPAKWYGSISTI
jgi:hypothetical protein